MLWGLIDSYKIVVFHSLTKSKCSPKKFEKFLQKTNLTLSRIF